MKYNNMNYIICINPMFVTKSSSFTDVWTAEGDIFSYTISYSPDPVSKDLGNGAEAFIKDNINFLFDTPPATMTKTHHDYVGRSHMISSKIDEHYRMAVFVEERECMIIHHVYGEAATRVLDKTYKEYFTLSCCTTSRAVLPIGPHFKARDVKIFSNTKNDVLASITEGIMHAADSILTVTRSEQ